MLTKNNKIFWQFGRCRMNRLALFVVITIVGFVFILGCISLKNIVFLKKEKDAKNKGDKHTSNHYAFKVALCGVIAAFLIAVLAIPGFINDTISMIEKIIPGITMESDDTTQKHTSTTISTTADTTTDPTSTTAKSATTTTKPVTKTKESTKSKTQTTKKHHTTTKGKTSTKKKTTTKKETNEKKTTAKDTEYDDVVLA